MRRPDSLLPSRRPSDVTRQEWLLVLAAAMVLAVVLTWPTVARFGTSGRVDSADGRFSLWNVAWVARALTTDPGSLFDANIFYPAHNALAFSELNLLAGVLAVPVWALTHNPYAALNSVVLISFVLSALCTYALARRLTGSVVGAAFSAVAFAYCAFVFSHHAHVQLLLTFVLPLALVTMHAFVDRPSLSRATGLAAALALAMLACGYYAVFAALIVAMGLVWFGLIEGRWRTPAFWAGAAWAAALTAVVAIVLFQPYAGMRSDGFWRSLDDSRTYSVRWRAYFASPMLIYQWMLPLLGSWREVLFPGFLPIGFGAFGVAIVWRHRAEPGQGARSAHMVAFYLAVALLGLWMSWGPDGGLYTAFYDLFPSVFAMMRAPARFGLLVTLGLAVLGGVGLAAIDRRLHGRARACTLLALGVLAIARSTVGPLPLTPAMPPNRTYQLLRDLPDGVVAEFPYFMDGALRPRQTLYMLGSTVHWKPLINGYSDHIPPLLFDDGQALATFPSASAWEVLQARKARYFVVHWRLFPEDQLGRIRAELDARSASIHRIAETPDASLFEILRPARAVSTD